MNTLEISPLDKLRSHNAEFEKSVYPLAPDVDQAVGYAASNVGMIIGSDGLIIIDTTESTEAAENILAEFRKITDKPVKTIIYTHSHRDHISGASVFASQGNVEIIAHHEFSSDLIRNTGTPAPDQALLTRTTRQFGIGLRSGTERINIGLGPGDRPMKGLGQGHIEPTTYIDSDGQSLERCGITLQLAFAPGECADNLVIYLPQTKVLFSADNFYKSFPNLYAIRGTAYRDFNAWSDSLQRLRQFNACVLAPGHSQPIYGAAPIEQALKNYEEAIRFIVEKKCRRYEPGFDS